MKPLYKRTRKLLISPCASKGGLSFDPNCFCQCCQLLKYLSDVVIVGVSGQEIKKRIINTSIPGVTARGVYTTFSSLKRAST